LPPEQGEQGLADDEVERVPLVIEQDLPAKSVEPER
jgi:hypothetical protein